MSDPRPAHRGPHVVRPTEPVLSSDEVNSGQLRALVERIERLNEEAKALREDIKNVFAEAKGCGFDPKIIRRIVQIRSQDPETRVEEETILDLYLAALGAS